VLRYFLIAVHQTNVQLINGGHVSPLIVRANGDIETISDGDLPVGLMESASFHVQHLNLGPGDRIVLLSDGISEAEDPEGTQFGTAELPRHLAEPNFVDNVFAELERFTEGAPAQDDQTILTIGRTA
jgi:phosphoserine phosphatase RsbU/P